MKCESGQQHRPLKKPKKKRTLVQCLVEPWPHQQSLEQCSYVVLFFMLNKVFLTFLSVNETLVCDQSNESYRAVLSCGTVYYAEQGVSNFPVCE